MFFKRSMKIVGGVCLTLGVAILLVCVSSWNNNSMTANLISGAIGIALTLIGLWVLTAKLRRKSTVNEGTDNNVKSENCKFVIDEAGIITEISSFAALEEAVRRAAGCSQNGITLSINPYIHGIKSISITPKRNEKGYCRITLLRELPKGTQFWMKQIVNPEEAVDIAKSLYVDLSMPNLMNGWTDFSKEYKKGTVEQKFKLMDDYFYKGK